LQRDFFMSGSSMNALLLRACAAALSALMLLSAKPVLAQNGDDLVLEAREALRKRDRQRLAAARAAMLAAPEAQRHPLTMWVDYWELSSRLNEATHAEVQAFYARWPSSYVEDRLRNDWLLEVGRRRDWAAFTQDFPRFRMNDDREVTCYSLITEHEAGRDVRELALAAWLAQRDADEGCALMAQTLFDAQRLTNADVWRKARSAVEAGRPRAAQKAAELLGKDVAKAMDELLDNPGRYLARKASTRGTTQAELTALAIARQAANDPEAAAGFLQQRFEQSLPPELASWVWSQVAKQAAQKLSPDANAWFRYAAQLSSRGTRAWSDDTLGWAVRAALRADDGRSDWAQVQATIGAMSEAEQRDPTWVYWRARALKALAPDGPDGAKLRAEGHELLMSLSGQMSFYGKLAAEDLGEPIALPARPVPLTVAEQAAAVQHPGLSRALQLVALGLRGEGVREWNFSLRGMADRELLAAAALACERAVWDRCINTSDRTRAEVDITQRFPTPFRGDVTTHAREVGIDPAYVYGLIRQESRFVMDARSHVGASGLMQLMPGTARWTAKKIGLRYTPDLITDRDTNLRLGMTYLKLALDDFEGSQALAAAAYNAGPGRPRRWRNGPQLDPAVWAENIPFSETRDYVKKVLSNATYYAVLLGDKQPSLRARLGRLIGPRDAGVPEPVPDLP
jgi:soluble lytic murein transglycosylase